MAALLLRRRLEEVYRDRVDPAGSPQDQERNLILTRVAFGIATSCPRRTTFLRFKGMSVGAPSTRASAAAATAWAARRNATKKASPCVSTSTPECLVNASRRALLCSPSRSAYRGPSSWRSLVDPSTSVKRRVTVPAGSSRALTARSFHRAATQRRWLRAAAHGRGSGAAGQVLPAKEFSEEHLSRTRAQTVDRACGWFTR